MKRKQRERETAERQGRKKNLHESLGRSPLIAKQRFCLLGGPNEPRRIPGTGEPGGLPPVGSGRVGHD